MMMCVIIRTHYLGLEMSQKAPCIKIHIPTYVSYTLGMTYRNMILESFKEDPRIMELLNIKLKDEKNEPQDVEFCDIITLINDGVLKKEPDSEPESDSDDYDSS
jgi:hypothetical protein